MRASVPRDDCRRWVELAGERGLILVIQPHVSRPGAADAVETREELLRYLDVRPGVFACPDTGHLALGGFDPVQTIRDLGERCRYVHLKDIRPEHVGKNTNPAKSSASWAPGYSTFRPSFAPWRTSITRDGSWLNATVGSGTMWPAQKTCAQRCAD